ncbi:hypothetical protein GCM10009718_37060 [Isoptericola halotolerans]|uniref:Uncharacterized protein n=1 Tax=Isoptericola halotolerans TaxID=300560 RepID=A0ABX2A960_9MICO|nr:hypothetical protein [Isoptericola halotolerans]NOV98236.1 hypothetical protein [Isoptericola halotolerans]
MRIDRRGRETVSWDLSHAPAGDIEATFDGTDWHTMDRSGETVSLLIAGPDAIDNPAGTVALASGRHYALLRAAAAPEVLIRSAGVIDVVTLPPA